MRTMVKIQVPVESGNEAVRSGRVGELLGSLGDRVQPEAMYCTTEDGKRTVYLFFNLQESSQIPVIAEPLFQELNASVQFTPVMNLEDLRRGLAQAAQD